VTTLEGAGLATQPYHATVPSFGVWGYVLAKKHAFDAPTTVAIDGLRYLTSDVLPGLFRFAPDMDRVPVDENRLNDQRLVRYYEREWSALN
jgi:spermidine synthase